MRSRKPPLRFRGDGTFTIVQFTDTEFCRDDEEERRMAAMMERILRTEDADLAVFTGDVIASLGHPDPVEAFRRACRVPEQAGVRWAAVFGNHDSEGMVTREQLHALQLAYPLNAAKPDPPGIHGSGNYVLTVMGSGAGQESKPAVAAGGNEDEAAAGAGIAGSKPAVAAGGNEYEAAAALYFLDSGSYSPLEYTRMGFYDWIRRDQIDWYASQSQRLTEGNGGVPLPSLAFFHIPLPEYNDVWDFAVCYGERNADFSCAPWINSGMFAAMVEMGDVVGTFAGHDHGHDYWGDWHGIRLSFGRTTRNGYLDRPFLPGARVIRMREGSREFESWIRLEDGTVIREQQRHEPTGRTPEVGSMGLNKVYPGGI
ncbi:metallophosphoesterase family protein [Paenibacillus humicus]|uniref:metallophosphoesterase family protein n=1 Tax=Paenibacillus humicus TaxID=412861 RepID=UPI000FD76C58|nr:metallophosphoesterase family protein [Paenibacillus humicus]